MPTNLAAWRKQYRALVYWDARLQAWHCNCGATGDLPLAHLPGCLAVRLAQDIERLTVVEATRRARKARVR